jgi:predicted RNA-binding protein with PUA-like domain
MVDIKLKEKFKNPVTLKAIKENTKLKNFRLIQKGNRLSVFPVNKKEWDEILRVGR